MSHCLESYPTEHRGKASGANRLDTRTNSERSVFSWIFCFYCCNRIDPWLGLDSEKVKRERKKTENFPILSTSESYFLMIWTEIMVSLSYFTVHSLMRLPLGQSQEVSEGKHILGCFPKCWLPSSILPCCCLFSGVLGIALYLMIIILVIISGWDQLQWF